MVVCQQMLCSQTGDGNKSCPAATIRLVQEMYHWSRRGLARWVKIFTSISFHVHNHFLNTFFRNQSKTRRVIYFIGMSVRGFIKTTTIVAQSCATNAMIPGHFQEFANKTSQQKRRRMQWMREGGGDAVMQTAAAKKNSRKAKKPSAPKPAPKSARTSPKHARRKSSRTQKQAMSNKKDIKHVCDENGCQHENIKRWERSAEGKSTCVPSGGQEGQEKDKRIWTCSAVIARSHWNHNV